ncbi:MAG: hypothetical protein ABI539_12825 [Acidobacteriota bacterium]
MEVFNELARSIDERWNEAGRDESSFPAIAESELRRATLPEKISAWDVIEWTLRQLQLPPQRDPHGNFGDPPITVFAGEDFYIDVYFWLNGTTEIHQHSFLGAFQVLAGSSIHSWYEFSEDEAFNGQIQFGRMSLKKCELLKMSDTQQIRPGRQYIHSLFHLDQPSATVTVRTDGLPAHLPQYSYHKPGLSLDPFFFDETRAKKQQALSALLTVGHESGFGLLSELMQNADLATSIDLLSTAHGFLTTNPLDELFALSEAADKFKSLLATFSENFPERADLLSSVFERHDVSNEIIRRRSYVTDPDLRFFLALLLNVEGRDAIFSLIKQRFPDADPLEKVLDWTFDLAQMRVVGIKSTNALGIPDFGDVDIFLFEKILQGASDDEAASELKATAAGGIGKFADLETKIARIRKALIFKPLFS